MDGRKCPYCAESIKAEALKCHCCGTDLTQSSWNDSERSGPAVVACRTCNVELIPVRVKRGLPPLRSARREALLKPPVGGPTRVCSGFWRSLQQINV